MREDKKRWILDYVNKNGGVDVLNSDFVDEYIEKFNARHFIQMYGANKCRELGLILSEMNKEGLLDRWVVPLCGMMSGFPKWVYSYDNRTRCS